MANVAHARATDKGGSDAGKRCCVPWRGRLYLKRRTTAFLFFNKFNEILKVNAAESKSSKDCKIALRLQK